MLASTDSAVPTLLLASVRRTRTWANRWSRALATAPRAFGEGHGPTPTGFALASAAAPAAIV